MRNALVQFVSRRVIDCLKIDVSCKLGFSEVIDFILLEQTHGSFYKKRKDGYSWWQVVQRIEWAEFSISLIARPSDCIQGGKRMLVQERKNVESLLWCQNIYMCRTTNWLNFGLSSFRCTKSERNVTVVKKWAEIFVLISCTFIPSFKVLVHHSQSKFARAGSKISKTSTDFSFYSFLVKVKIVLSGNGCCSEIPAFISKIFFNNNPFRMIPTSA